MPFCPTRCAYCSFVSHSVEQAAKLIPDYVDRLCGELAATGEIARELGLRLRTVYFGGGTPTTLTADQLSRVMDAVAAHFDVASAWEYTVEAGRPDTVTEDKLRAIKAGGGRRVSINPQTLSDGVLAEIGRRHTSARFFEAFELARKVGFDCINTDLIAGLPTDTPEGFRASVDGVLALAPENVTVHTLTVKRASRLSFGEARAELALVDGMVGYARRAAAAAASGPTTSTGRTAPSQTSKTSAIRCPAGRDSTTSTSWTRRTPSSRWGRARPPSCATRSPGRSSGSITTSTPTSTFPGSTRSCGAKSGCGNFTWNRKSAAGACKSPGQRV